VTSDQLHGYVGRWFCLVTSDGEPKGSTNPTVLLPGALSLVQFWKDDSDSGSHKKSSRASRSVHSNSSYGSVGSGDGSSIGIAQTKVFHGDLIVEGSIRARGDVECGAHGVLRGRLETRQADYAEWFPAASPKGSARMVPGTVVQYQAGGRALSLDTSGQGPIMVVSTDPSVTGGLGERDAAAKAVGGHGAGAVCAFIGRVPVRVRGAVAEGDILVPSGRNDGFAVSLNSAVGVELNSRYIIGTAMDASAPGACGADGDVELGGRGTAEATGGDVHVRAVRVLMHPQQHFALMEDRMRASIYENVTETVSISKLQIMNQAHRPPAAARCLTRTSDGA